MHKLGSYFFGTSEDRQQRANERLLRDEREHQFYAEAHRRFDLALNVSQTLRDLGYHAHPPILVRSQDRLGTVLIGYHRYQHIGSLYPLPIGVSAGYFDLEYKLYTSEPVQGVVNGKTWVLEILGSGSKEKAEEIAKYVSLNHRVEVKIFIRTDPAI